MSRECAASKKADLVVCVKSEILAPNLSNQSCDCFYVLPLFQSILNYALMTEIGVVSGHFVRQTPMANSPIMARNGKFAFTCTSSA